MPEQASTTIGNSNKASTEQHDIDRILQVRRMSQVKSCYPCRQRKVRCDHRQPCQTCQKRRHPEICTYGIDAPDLRRMRRRGTSLNPTEPTEDTGEQSPSYPPHDSSVPPTIGDPIADSTKPIRNHYETVNQCDPRLETSQPGDSSVLVLLDRATQDFPGQMREKARPVLGLSNTLDISPFTKAKTAQELWTAVLGIIPQQQELQMFFPFNRSHIYPLSPILADFTSLETELCNYAQALASGEFRSPDRISSNWITKGSLSKIALLLSALATGAHSAALQSPRRRFEVCLDLTQRTFEALRLANFALHPTLDNVQALVIIESVLQDCGQSDGSWVLLGTTIRLAQAVGLHRRTYTSTPDDAYDRRSRAIWDYLARQDCLLSITHGRPAMASMEWLSDPPVPYYNSTRLLPADIMRGIARIALKVMSTDLESNWDECLELLSQLDDCDSHSELYLRRRDKCVNLQQHFDHLTIRVHLSFLASMICRPVLTGFTQLHEPRCVSLRNRAKQSLVDTSRNFLEFQALSVIPMRTWSITHSVLCSTILLCAWEETRDSPDIRELQRQVVEAFARAARLGDESGDDKGNTWLTTGHIMALVALQKALRGSSFIPSPPRLGVEQLQNPTPLNEWPVGDHPEAELNDANFNFAAMLDDDFLNQLDECTWDQTCLPPIEYLNAIMNTTGKL